MVITDYTSYREVRTACGLTEHDVSDTMLSDNLFADALYLAMSEITLPDVDPGPGTIATRFAEISVKESPLQTDKEKLLVVLTRLFATYLVASELCKSISLSAAKLRSDGKTVDSRFSTDLAFSSVRAGVFSTLAKYKLAIENISDTAALSYGLITVVKPTTDVVTNQ